MEKKMFFDSPTQVQFVDFEGCNNDYIEWKGGIAFRDVIICGCCGGIISLEEFWYDWDDWAEKELKDLVSEPLKLFRHWVPISEDIVGY